MVLGERTTAVFESLNEHLQFTTAVVAAGQDLTKAPTVAESRRLGLPQRRGCHCRAALAACGASHTRRIPRTRAELPHDSGSGLFTNSDTVTPYLITTTAPVPPTSVRQPAHPVLL